MVFGWRRAQTLVAGLNPAVVTATLRWLPVGIAPAQPSSWTPVLLKSSLSGVAVVTRALKRPGFARVRPCEWSCIPFGLRAEHRVVPDNLRVGRHEMPWLLALRAPPSAPHREKAPSLQGPRAFAFRRTRQVTPPSRSDPPWPEHPETGNHVPCRGWRSPSLREGERHVRNAREERNAPRRRAAGRLRACPGVCRAQAGGGRAVQTAPDRVRT